LDESTGAALDIGEDDRQVAKSRDLVVIFDLSKTGRDPMRVHQSRSSSSRNALLIIAIASTLLAANQSALPQGAVGPSNVWGKCPSSAPASSWSNCVGSLTLPDGGKYQGEIISGSANGQGVIVPSSGRAFRYVGEVRNNTIDGYGTIIFKDGEKYIGDFVQGSFEGQGTLTRSDGGIYSGQFLSGAFHGRGSLTDSAGNRFIGEFRNGLRHGQGALTSANGDRFNGEFREGLFHGKGTLTYKDSSTYSGDFRDGLFHGRGTFRNSDGSQFIGEYRSGLKNGPGVFISASGSRFEGEYRDDRWNGSGTYQQANGETYIGEFRDGQFYGKGLYTFPNGEKYEGEFRNNNFDGRGVFNYLNGAVYVGEFRDGKIEGTGSYIAKSGEKYEGEYRLGKRDGRGVATSPEGIRYVGEFNSGVPSGLGIEYDKSGTIIRRGAWEKGQLVSSVELDPSLFPFDSQTQNRAGAGSAGQPAASDSAQILTQQRRAAEAAKAAEAEKARAAAIERERQLAEERRREAEVKALLGKRLALVIGNATYSANPLKNPENDAEDVSRALKESGFTVIEVRNGSLGKMRQAVRQFGDMLNDHDVGLVYYSGHGVEVNGRNYLIPVNADIAREDEVADQSVDMGLILEKMATAKKAVNILIMDACRDNPFGLGFRSRSKGLAMLDAPRGTIIAYATSPGRVADDGTGRNSPYTKNLLKFMQIPNKPIESVFKDVRRGVQQDTKGAQTPWENTSLSGDFFFRVQR
jgi:hypothetical protein